MARHNPSEIIREIGESFPCFRGDKLSYCFCEGQFYPDDLVLNMGYFSHGEQQVGRFLLTLWNRPFAKKKKCLFDATEALAVWDMGNRAAYVAWCQHPVYP